MRSITIHGLDDELDKEIRAKAKNQGTSLNKTIKRLLKKALGFKSQTGQDYRDEFMDLFGVWKEEDYKEFIESIKDFKAIDSGDWQ